ncbi:MAG: hypothetical protein ACW99G_17855 [Candidatus Thorarchaeota archaeon]|jgi:hypothetical protein
MKEWKAKEFCEKTNELLDGFVFKYDQPYFQTSEDKDISVMIHRDWDDDGNVYSNVTVSCGIPIPKVINGLCWEVKRKDNDETVFSGVTSRGGHFKLVLDPGECEYYLEYFENQNQSRKVTQ